MIASSRYILSPLGFNGVKRHKMPRAICKIHTREIEPSRHLIRNCNSALRLSRKKWHLKGHTQLSDGKLQQAAPIRSPLSLHESNQICTLLILLQAAKTILVPGM